FQCGGTGVGSRARGCWQRGNGISVNRLALGPWHGGDHTTICTAENRPQELHRGTEKGGRRALRAVSLRRTGLGTEATSTSARGVRRPAPGNEPITIAACRYQRRSHAPVHPNRPFVGGRTVRDRVCRRGLLFARKLRPV